MDFNNLPCPMSLSFLEVMSPVRGDVNIPTYKPHTNHKKPSVSSHTLAPTTICDLSHSVCWSPLTDLGHISSVTYVCHPLWFVCGHRKGILTSSLNKPEQGPMSPCRFYMSRGIMHVRTKIHIFYLRVPKQPEVGSIWPEVAGKPFHIM